MRLFKAINTTRHNTLAAQVKLADQFLSRLQGLLGTTSLPAGQGLLLLPCNSIHSIGMAYSIDAIFLDKENTVVNLLSDFKPLRISAVYHKAHSCLELPSGTIINTSTAIGDKLVFEELMQP